jgi:hypothetical protein
VSEKAKNKSVSSHYSNSLIYDVLPVMSMRHGDLLCTLSTTWILAEVKLGY